MARSTFPAVTHVDYSARMQTVTRRRTRATTRSSARFTERTGCPVLVNTSFNVRGEPIVCTPEDAFGCFMGTRSKCSLRRTAISTRNARAPRRAGATRTSLSWIELNLGLERAAGYRPCSR